MLVQVPTRAQVRARPTYELTEVEYMSDVKIWAIKPDMMLNGHVNVKFTNGDKEVSLALDDSCGSMDHCRRGTVACFEGNNSVTAEVFGDDSYDIHLSMVNFERALAWLKG